MLWISQQCLYHCVLPMIHHSMLCIQNTCILSLGRLRANIIAYYSLYHKKNIYSGLYWCALLWWDLWMSRSAVIAIICRSDKLWETFSSLQAQEPFLEDKTQGLLGPSCLRPWQRASVKEVRGSSDPGNVSFINDEPVLCNYVSGSCILLNVLINYGIVRRPYTKGISWWSTGH